MAFNIGNFLADSFTVATPVYLRSSNEFTLCMVTHDVEVRLSIPVMIFMIFISPYGKTSYARRPRARSIFPGHLVFGSIAMEITAQGIDMFQNDRRIRHRRHLWLRLSLIAAAMSPARTSFDLSRLLAHRTMPERPRSHGVQYGITSNQRSTHEEGQVTNKRVSVAILERQCRERFVITLRDAQPSLYVVQDTVDRRRQPGMAGNHYRIQHRLNTLFLNANHRLPG